MVSKEPIAISVAKPPALSGNQLVKLNIRSISTNLGWLQLLSQYEDKRPKALHIYDFDGSAIRVAVSSQDLAPLHVLP